MGGCFKVTSAVLYALLSLIAVVAIGLGVWVILKENSFIIIFGISETIIVGWIFIGLGITLFLSGFCGCCGSLKESKSCLIMFMVLVILVCIGFLIVGTVSILRTRKISMALKSHTKQKLLQNYGFDKQFTVSWNDIQVEYACCGVDEATDYESSRWYQGNGTKNFPRDGQVPHSCCKRPDENSFVLRENCNKKKPIRENQFINQEGCFLKIHPIISKVIYWFAIGSFIIGGFIFLLLLLSCILICRINRSTLYGQVV